MSLPTGSRCAQEIRIGVLFAVARLTFFFEMRSGLAGNFTSRASSICPRDLIFWSRVPINQQSLLDIQILFAFKYQLTFCSSVPSILLYFTWITLRRLISDMWHLVPSVFCSCSEQLSYIQKKPARPALRYRQANVQTMRTGKETIKSNNKAKKRIKKHPTPTFLSQNGK